MSTYINKGNQKISWNFQSLLQANSVNKRFLNILPLGIYSGYSLSAETTGASGSNIIISAGILEIQDLSAGVQIKCQTTENYSLSGITSAAPFIHAYYVWNNRDDWYVDFVGLPSAQGTSAVPTTQYICLGTALFNPASGNITGFNYDDRQNVIFQVKVNIESVHDEVANFLSAGPGISLTYDDPNGILEISARGITNIHGKLLGLTADDHKQYLLSDGTRQISADWNINQKVSGGKAVSAGTIVCPTGTSMGISGSRLDLFIYDIVNNLLSAGPNIALTYDVINSKLEISAATSGSITGSNIIHKISSLVSLVGNLDIAGSVISQTLKISPEIVGGNFWTIKNNIGTARKWLGGFSVGGYGYNCAGEESGPTYSSASEQYNDTLNLWTSKQALNIIQGGPTVGFSLHDFGYIVNGASGISGTNWSKYCQKYNILTNTWATKTETNILHGRAGGCSIGSFGYVFAGLSAAGEASPGLKSERYNDLLNTWTYVADGLTNRSYISSFEFNNFGYIVGGATSLTASTPITERYSDILNLCVSRKSLPFTTVTSPVEAGGFSVNSHGYYFGGYHITAGTFYKNMYEYNDIGDYWTRVLDYPIDGNGYGTLGGESLNGFGYSFGGSSGVGSYYSSCYQYRNVSMLVYPISFKNSRTIPDGIYVGTNINNTNMSVPVWVQTDITGAWHYLLSNKANTFPKQGQTLSTILSATSAGAYDYKIKVGVPRTQGLSARSTWITIAPLLSGELSPVAWNINGFGFVVGDTSTQKYQSDLNIWTPKAKRTATMDHAGGFSLNGIGYAFGGATASIHDDTQIYNELLDTWALYTYETIGDMWSPAGFTLNKYGYIVGGASTSPLILGTELDSCYKFDDSALTYTQMANMSEKRLAPAAFSLQGLGYVGGGRADLLGVPTFSVTVERYNDAANTWTTVDSIARARVASIGTSDRNFGIFSKGVSSSDIVDELNNAEIYYPVLNNWKTEGIIGAAAIDPGGFTLSTSMYVLGGTYRSGPGARALSTECDKRISPNKNIDLTTTLLIE